MAWTFCEKEDVTSIYPINVAELEDRHSDFVEAMILQYKGNPYIGSPVTVTDEYHNGDNTDILQVKKPPIISVSSLSISDAVLLPADYVVFPYYIQLKAQRFPRGRLNVKVTYESGVAAGNIDPQVSFCAALMIEAIINHRSRLGADDSVKFNRDVEKMYGAGVSTLSIGLVNHLRGIMHALLRRDKVRVK